MTGPLRARVAGQAVMAETLRLQAGTPRRRGLARLFGANPLAPEARSWYAGAVGEMRVARALSKLGPEWHVLHSIPVGTRGSDIDHLVVGPGGVFTLNTKNHAGKDVWVAGSVLMVNGQHEKYLRNSAHEAKRAAALLTRAVGREVPVRAAVVLVAPRRVTIRRFAEGAAVVTDSQLRRWLTKQAKLLNAGDAARLAAVAAEPSTWGHQQAPSEDPSATRMSFGALHTAVMRAQGRRLVWAGAAAVTLFGSAAGSIWLR
ncbi:nuclease-related domain-containing protein [Sinomonas sp. ASV486]|uniref:nuclease-related domain-containing protein n=1 Tax=Sinomonas sp. ASV486 TaxID=3051170 RepID=UPI0027DE2929|nr:nuclease-related domain-containing protein [Sinomonas sp. ASV486]MDQ4489167.1 nuclease-related domain-containing protein [Sinomonas sp. ASV486]